MSGNQATLSDLKEVLKDTLQARGSLDQIRARVRAEIFAALDDQSVPKPTLSNENLVINELIREYLEYNGYRHALSVFLPESGQPTETPFDRAFLSSELNVVEDPRFTHVPLLYSIVACLQQAKAENDACQRTGLDRFSTQAERFTDPDAAPSPLPSINVSPQNTGNEPAPLMFKK